MPANCTEAEPVNRRTGGLEIFTAGLSNPLHVNRRTGGLEIMPANCTEAEPVNRRTGGLEI